MKKKLLILDDSEMMLGLLEHCLSDNYTLTLATSVEETMQVLESGYLPDGIITDLNLPGVSGQDLIKEIKSQPQYNHIPIMVLSGEEKSQSRIECLKAGAEDFLTKPFHPEELNLRIEKLLSGVEQKKDSKGDDNQPREMVSTVLNAPAPKSSFGKRLIDILFSGTALLFLSPILLLVAIMIRLDSKGPVFFRSKRVGAGYKVFDLYKFRTMKVGADKEVGNMNHLNMYQSEALVAEKDEKEELVNDKGWMSEESYLTEKKQEAAFLKFKNDPRITRLGSFLRNTSIDELPQLLNILKGDMSLVGNRPLPLYEAEKLTKDESVARFLAPAGLTGLWQVTKRGKGDLSAEERIELDNSYAKKHSLLYDIKLMAKTIPALFQSEKM